MSWFVYVEGVSDARFLECLAHYMELTNIKCQEIGSNMEGLRNIHPLMQQVIDGGDKVAVVVDANSNFDIQRDRLRTIIEQHELPVANTFLLPDNQRSGNLETLLEDIAVPSHKEIYRCFDAYEKCLLKADRSYNLPDPKARVYAYCNALGTEARSPKRDYGNVNHWDLDAPALKPLKQFLSSLQS